MRTGILVLALLVISIVSCKKDTTDEFIGDSGVFTDKRDGKEYSWVRIGDQIWMAENLAYLPEVYTGAEGSEDPGKENDSFYYVYGYNGTNVEEAKATNNYNTYGVLYNWRAAMESCPDGWHLSTDDDWLELEEEMGITDNLLEFNVYRGDYAGDRLKETGTVHWSAPNDGATDEFGFSALAAGHRSVAFSGLGDYCWILTATRRPEISSPVVIWRAICSWESGISRTFSVDSGGWSVRCVKD